ncbi:MAG TPA: hypothetical protein VG125_12950, partial [Pirellulales bacterium]|nr:hypothetical protein [Pirellulales bacterium]
ARSGCGFDLQGFSAAARLDFDSQCGRNSKASLDCEIVCLAFSIVAVAKLVCSGNPYAIEGLADPLAEGRASAMAMLSRELKKYCDKLELYERGRSNR